MEVLWSILWNTYGGPMEHHRSNTGAVRYAALVQVACDIGPDGPAR